MAYEIVVNKRFTNRLINVLKYLETEWGPGIADEFLKTVYSRISSLQSFPFIGSLTSISNVRSVIVTKHNRMYYRIEGRKIVILNMYDTRRKPKTNG